MSYSISRIVLQTYVDISIKTTNDYNKLVIWLLDPEKVNKTKYLLLYLSKVYQNNRYNDMDSFPSRSWVWVPNKDPRKVK